jgi:16S rRNA (cytidine1402-2'-O)-methyltransferase
LVCATPIGNLGDVTVRVLDALRDADLVVAEDTRITRRLLARYDISARLEPYHAHNLDRRTPVLIDRMRRGARIALVSDAGTPGISDPGAHLVDACLQTGIAVDVLPGPSAIVSALVASGLPTHAFYFGGFLPRKVGERGERLASLSALDATLVFYESPRRAPSTAVALAAAFPSREAAMARELTKVHEEVVRGSVEELAQMLASRELKGEVVLLVGPPPRGHAAVAPDPAEVLVRIAELQSQGVSRSSAVKQVAAEYGMARNEAYRIAHGEVADAKRAMER